MAVRRARLLVASLIALLTPPGGDDARAHTGTPGTLCGSVDTVAAIYEFQWSDWFYYPAPHFHRWHPPTNPSGWWDEHCGYEF